MRDRNVPRAYTVIFSRMTGNPDIEASVTIRHESLPCASMLRQALKTSLTANVATSSRPRFGRRFSKLDLRQLLDSPAEGCLPGGVNCVQVGV